MKKDGYFLTTVMTDKWNDYLMGKKIFGSYYIRFMKWKQQHINLLSNQQWRKEFQTAGFTTIDQIGYLPEPTAQYLDAAHYLSLPLLLFPNLALLMGFDKPIHSILKRSLQTKISKSAAIFYLLKK